MRALWLLPLLLLPFTAFAEPFQWNVLLREWQVAGPYPTRDDGALGLNTDFIGWNGKPDTCTEPVEWKSFNTNTMHTPEDASRRNVLFYAAASVTVEKETEVVMAFGAHQSVVIWHDTTEIFRFMSKNRSRVDNFKLNLKLHPGENWFLFKTHSEIGAQRVLARFLPPKITRPLVALRYTGLAVDTLPQEFPDLTLNFLDKKGKLIEKHRLSGNVSIASELAFFSLFTPKPKQTPSEVQVSFADHEAAGSLRIPWSAASSRIVDFDLAIPQTFRISLAPLPNDLTVHDERGSLIPHTATPEGIEFTAPSAPVIVREFDLRAPGHKTRKCQVSPLAPVKIAELEKGCTLTGKIVNAEGKGVVGTRVQTLMDNKFYAPQTTVDETGKFVLPGLPNGENILLLIAPPGDDSPALMTNVQIGNEPEQELQGKIATQPAARLRGKIRSGKSVPPFAKVLLSGPQMMLTSSVGPDGSFDLAIPPGPILSITAIAPDLRPERRLLDLSNAPSLKFDFEMVSSPPAYLEFVGKNGELETLLFPSFAFPDGPLPVTWFCLANGKFVVPNAPNLLTPVNAFLGGMNPKRFFGKINGPGEYQIHEGMQH